MADYSRADALKYRDYLIAKGMAGSSVSRVISSLRAVMNFVISEYALDLKNPFVGIYHDRLVGVSKRPPIPIEDIRKVQQQCLSLDDDLRWLVALVLGFRRGRHGPLGGYRLYIYSEVHTRGSARCWLGYWTHQTGLH